MVVPSRDLNQRPVNCKSVVLPIAPPCHPVYKVQTVINLAVTLSVCLELLSVCQCSCVIAIRCLYWCLYGRVCVCMYDCRMQTVTCRGSTFPAGNKCLVSRRLSVDLTWCVRILLQALFILATLEVSLCVQQPAMHKSFWEISSNWKTSYCCGMRAIVIHRESC